MSFSDVSSSYAGSEISMQDGGGRMLKGLSRGVKFWRRREMAYKDMLAQVHGREASGAYESPAALPDIVRDTAAVFYVLHLAAKTAVDPGTQENEYYDAMSQVSKNIAKIIPGRYFVSPVSTKPNDEFVFHESMDKDSLEKFTLEDIRKQLDILCNPNSAPPIAPTVVPPRKKNKEHKIRKPSSHEKLVEEQNKEVYVKLCIIQQKLFKIEALTHECTWNTETINEPKLDTASDLPERLKSYLSELKTKNKNTNFLVWPLHKPTTTTNSTTTTTNSTTTTTTNSTTTSTTTTDINQFLIWENVSEYFFLCDTTNPDTKKYDVHVYLDFAGVE
jgi:hypothetical protein